MKRILNISTVLVCAMALLLGGCRRDPSKPGSNTLPFIGQASSTLSPIADFMQSAAQPHDGMLSVSSFQTLATQNEPCDPTIFRGGFNDNGTHKCYKLVPATSASKWHSRPGAMIYKEVPCPQSTVITAGLSSNFGTTVAIAADLASTGSDFGHEMYMPTKLHVMAPVFSHDLYINAGETLTWNPDDDNPKNDAIYITYDPTSYENAPVSGGATTPITIGIDAGHTGSYTITSSDLAQFPQGAYITIAVNRYNWESFTNPDLSKDYFAMLGSTVEGLFIVGTSGGVGGGGGGGGEE